jgi:hypothetical protein
MAIKISTVVKFPLENNKKDSRHRANQMEILKIYGYRATKIW